MRSKTAQLNDYYGGDWFLAHDRVWHDRKSRRKCRRVITAEGKSVHLLYANGEITEINLARGNRKRKR